MAKKLKKSDNSGRVTEKVKMQLFVNSLGVCAEPDCNQRLMENRSTLGDCAHIIPRKENSHPRGREKISDEDRNKEANLIYLCARHHRLIDDKQHADFYTADRLREWKKRHEDWAKAVTKASPYLSQKTKNFFAKIENQFTEFSEQERASSFVAIKTLLPICRNLLDSFLIKEAHILLSQIYILLLGASNDELKAETDFMGALISVRNEEIPKAKKQLLEIVSARPNYIEPMLEYIELCDGAPEPTDELEKIKKLACELDKNHPHLLAIDLSRQYKNQEPIEDEIIFDKKPDDPRLAARLFGQYAMLCDMASKTEQRDTLLDQWQEVIPSSPSPYRFRAMYKMFDVLRNSTEQADTIIAVLEFSKQQRQATEDKDPIAPRGQMEWLLNEMKLTIALFRISGEYTGFNAIRDDIILLIGKCYFDNIINGIASDLLYNLAIEPNQWQMIVSKIQDSKVAPSKELVTLLFLHALPHNELSKDLAKFVKKYGQAELLQIATAIKNNNAEKLAKLVNAKKDSHFSLILLQSIARYEVAVALANLLEIEPDHQEYFTSLRVNILAMKAQDDDALNFITEDSIKQVNLSALSAIENLLFRKEQWHLFIRAALRLLSLSVPDDYKTQVHSKLAVAYLKQNDDSNAIVHAENALSKPEHLGEDIACNTLFTLGQAMMNKGQADEACHKFVQYVHIKRAFGLLMLEADSYLKSNLDDKYNKALSPILKAFGEIEVYEDKFYLPAFMLLVELSNAGVIPNKDEPAVKDGSFVKLEGFSNWFYIGEDTESFDAECIESGTPNYKALIGKSVGNKINWPANKFSNHKHKPRILHISKAPSFLNHRAHEVMGNAAQTGNKGVHTIQVMDDEGNFSPDRLKQFLDEQDRPRKEFFEDYVSKGLPFAFLCKMHGSLSSALGILSSEQRGFVRCSNGSRADMDEQSAVAREVLNGAPCFIEGLAALVLAESGLLKDVVDAVPNLGVSSSMIGLLREIAGNFEISAGKGGRGGFVKDKFQFREIDKAREGTIRNKLLAAADLLDELPGKEVSKTYSNPKSEKDLNLDNTLPNYFADAFHYAQEKKIHILTDDPLFVHAYKVVGETQIPQHFSSIALIRAMADNKQIDLQRYYEYFAFLSSYRYHFLSFSIDDMINVVLPRLAGVLVTPAPENISLLNLSLTLSQDYGIEDKKAVAVLSMFFIRLILDNSVTPEIADKIFGLTLAQAMEKRDKKLMAKALSQGCSQIIQRENWVGQRSRQKLDALDKQLVRMATLSMPYPKLTPPD